MYVITGTGLGSFGKCCLPRFCQSARGIVQRAEPVCVCFGKGGISHPRMRELGHAGHDGPAG